jgi:hypothetical protein
MDYCVGTFEAAGIDCAGLWIPLKDEVIGSNRLAHDPYNFVAVPEEMGTQCSADQAARSCDHDPHVSRSIEVMPDFDGFVVLVQPAQAAATRRTVAPTPTAWDG